MKGMYAGGQCCCMVQGVASWPQLLAGAGWCRLLDPLGRTGEKNTSQSHLLDWQGAPLLLPLMPQSASAAQLQQQHTENGRWSNSNSRQSASLDVHRLQLGLACWRLNHGYHAQ